MSSLSSLSAGWKPYRVRHVVIRHHAKHLLNIRRQELGADSKVSTAYQMGKRSDLSPDADSIITPALPSRPSVSPLTKVAPSGTRFGGSVERTLLVGRYHRPVAHRLTDQDQETWRR